MNFKVITHSSAYLLPTIPTSDAPALTYALIILNQPLPRFTPQLWKHAQVRVCADGGANRLFDDMPHLFPKEDAHSVRIRWGHRGWGYARWFQAELYSYTDFICSGGLMDHDACDIVRHRELALVSCWIVSCGKYKPDVVKGDLDSIRADVQEFYSNLGTKIEDASLDQDTTDLHKCVDYIVHMPNLEKSNLCILAVGALGGRFDHEMGNVNVLCRFSDVRLILLSDHCLIQLLPHAYRHEIHAQSSIEGPECGLIPICGPSRHTTTTGLKWNLNDDELSFGELVSTSNSVQGDIVTVTCDSDLLWTITIKRPEEECS